MSNAAIYSVIAGVAIVMLVVSFRAQSWHKISRLYQLLLLAGVVYATWQLVTRGSPMSFEPGLLFILCALVGLVVGFARGQAATMRYDAALRDVVCKRGGFLIFCWAAAALAIITLHSAPERAVSPGWLLGLNAALVFLAISFVASTLTLFARSSGIRHEHEYYSEGAAGR
jgi:hypothetical protein